MVSKLNGDAVVLWFFDTLCLLIVNYLHTGLLKYSNFDQCPSLGEIEISVTLKRMLF